MPTTTRIVVITNLHGRVLAAELPSDGKVDVSEDEPIARILPMEGQRSIAVDVPREVLNLPGPSLHRFFSELQIRWPADVQVPKVEIVKGNKEVKDKKRRKTKRR